MTLSDRIVVMRDGRVAQSGRPEEVYRRPADTFVATFVGSPKMNLIDGTVSNGELRTAGGLRLTIGGPATDSVTVGVRPDDLLLTPDPDGSAVVELVELLGPRAIVTVRAGEHRLTSVVPAAALTEIGVGTRVELSATPADVHRFDVSTGLRLD